MDESDEEWNRNKDNNPKVQKTKTIEINPKGAKNRASTGQVSTNEVEEK